MRQLLDDIREFAYRPNAKPNEFYCLQPLVVKPQPSSEYEVVDGQQRLTTILLIHLHLNERLAEKYRETTFRLRYETRPHLESFLASPDAASADKNIDYYYLYQAFQEIEAWFAEHEGEVEDVKATLFKRTKVIWYELGDDDDPIAAFTRLNVGKIPLTSDELIRALFLRRDRPDLDVSERKQIQIAQEWDRIEKSLQRDDFWHFVCNDSTAPGHRIAFLFDIVVRAHGFDPEGQGEYATFYAVSEVLDEPGQSSDKLWLETKQAFQTLEEWFEDRRLFHLVGFLIIQGTSIHEIMQLSIDCPKSEFDDRLRDRIYKVIMNEELGELAATQVQEHVSNRLSELRYGAHSDKLRAVLLLFNLASLIQDHRSNLRFQFDAFKLQRWDLEHIRSVTDARPERRDARLEWLQHCQSYFEALDKGHELLGRINHFLGLSHAEATNEEFDALYDALLEHFEEAIGGPVEHGIGNLTLLDSQTNRSYKNAVFAVKRWRLLHLDQAGIFIPLCTRNAFLKAYSPHVGHSIVWTPRDQEMYEHAVTATLTALFVGNQGAGA